MYQYPKTGTVSIDGFGINVGQGSDAQFLYSLKLQNAGTEIYAKSGLPGSKKIALTNISVVKDTWLTASFQCHQSTGDFGMFYRVIYD